VLVDWSILALVCVEIVTGVLGLGAGHLSAWLLFDLHAVVGIALLVLLGFKLARVRHRVTTARLWDRATPLSILQAVVVLATIGLGVYWTMGGDLRIWFWTALNVHIGLGLLLVPLILLHLRARDRPLRRTDFQGRRTAVQYAGLLVGGAVAYRAQETVNALVGGAGDSRRFTGSKPVDATTMGDGDVDPEELSLASADDGEGVGDGDDGDDDGAEPGDPTADDGDVDAGNGSFPVTSWVADDPDPVDPSTYRLTVDGLVETPRTYRLDDVEAAAGTTDRVLLDCTSGWYTVQDWRGVGLGDLLTDASVREEARWVTVHSVTGYRWSYPLAEARELLLATHVGGERLSHGHGFPLRLVAPDRRGFQWVKWVDRIEVRRRRDASQYLATLISGLD
jgi:DMSO/TMAO reductase YedYZ molybdopterin-dependent catalytic subunit